MPASCVEVRGPNGSGKSTLLRLDRRPVPRLRRQRRGSGLVSTWATSPAVSGLAVAARKSRVVPAGKAGLVCRRYRDIRSPDATRLEDAMAAVGPRGLCPGFPAGACPRASSGGRAWRGPFFAPRPPVVAGRAVDSARCPGTNAGGRRFIADHCAAGRRGAVPPPIRSSAHRGQHGGRTRAGAVAMFAAQFRREWLCVARARDEVLNPLAFLFLGVMLFAMAFGGEDGGCWRTFAGGNRLGPGAARQPDVPGNPFPAGLRGRVPRSVRAAGTAAVRQRFSPRWPSSGVSPGFLPSRCWRRWRL